MAEKQKPESLFDSYRNVRVGGAIGDIIFSSVPMPLEVYEELKDQGVPVPLDIVPTEYWTPTGSPFPRFSAEALGKDF